METSEKEINSKRHTYKQCINLTDSKTEIVN